jgi:hypothetical protein
LKRGGVAGVGIGLATFGFTEIVYAQSGALTVTSQVTIGSKQSDGRSKITLNSVTVTNSTGAAVSAKVIWSLNKSNGTTPLSDAILSDKECSAEISIPSDGQAHTITLSYSEVLFNVQGWSHIYSAIDFSSANDEKHIAVP